MAWSCCQSDDELGDGLVGCSVGCSVYGLLLIFDNGVSDGSCDGVLDGSSDRMSDGSVDDGIGDEMLDDFDDGLLDDGFVDGLLDVSLDEGWEDDDGVHLGICLLWQSLILLFHQYDLDFISCFTFFSPNFSMSFFTLKSNRRNPGNSVFWNSKPSVFIEVYTSK